MGQHRLTREEIGYISKKGRRFQKAHVGATILTNPSEKNIKAGYAIVVPKKAIKSAVGRNKAKRRTKAIVIRNFLNKKNRSAIVFFLRKGSNTAKFSTYKEEVNDLFNKI